MGKKKANAAAAARALESSVAPILEVKYEDPLFTAAAHPTKPILLNGLVTGHVYCKTYDSAALEEQQRAEYEKLAGLERDAFNKGQLDEIKTSVSQARQKWWTVADLSDDHEHFRTNWKTKRHKGSVRHAIFDPLPSSVGENVYTVGTDHIIKKAATETGKVVSKVDLLGDYENKNDAVTKLCHSASHNFLLAGTENGSVLIYDSANLGAKVGSTDSQLKFKVPKAHDDAVNAIIPMPDVSAYHYLTLGSTTLSHIDIRKGIVTQSDDQEDELLAMCYPTDYATSMKNDTVLVAHGEGIITIWKQSNNGLKDQISRVKVNKGVSVDAIIATMNNENEDMTNSVWCGDSEGILYRVNYKKGRVVETRVHSPVITKSDVADEVGILDIDYEYRLISAGMDGLKIWSGRSVDDIDAEKDDDSDNENDSLDGFSGFSGSDSEPASEQDDEESDGEQNEEESDGDEEDEEQEVVEAPKIQRRERRDITKLISKPKKKMIDINKVTAIMKEKEEEQKKEEEKEAPSKKKQKKSLSAKQLRHLQTQNLSIKRFDDL